MKKILTVFAGTLIATLVFGAGLVLANPPGGGHTPVTICHKPGTPAEQTLVVDDDAVPGHLGHGDTLGPCSGGETTTTDTTTTNETTTTETTTDQTTTTETETTPSVPCVPQNPDGSPGGKDGVPGNDSCAKDPEPEPTPTTPEETTPTEEPTVTPTVEPPAVTEPPVVEEPTEAPVDKPKLEKELDKQAKKNGAVKGAGATATNPNELPNTGLPLLPIAALGAGLVGAGLRLRRK